VSDLRKALELYQGEYIFTAAGATNTRAYIDVEQRPMMSSFLARTDLTSTGKHVEKREVEVKTLDTLMEEYGFEPPFGLKIDTEGFEDQVIRGATNFLRRTEFVIAELSVAERFMDSYTFAAFTGLMDKNDFILWDVLGVSGVRFLDVAFVSRSKKVPGTGPGRNRKVRRKLPHFADVPDGSRKSVEGLRAGINLGLLERIYLRRPPLQRRDASNADNQILCIPSRQARMLPTAHRVRRLCAWGEPTSARSH
jgi:FkbM family methyltransferase